MEQPTSKDARGPINLRIKFRSESVEQFIERYSIDVSRGGIFIRTREPLAVGTQLKFDFQLQDAAPLMAGEGTVVWIREYDANRTGVTPGMGVRFDKLTPTSQPVLEKILTEKSRRDQNAASPGTTSKVGAGMAVRRPSSTFTALDPAVTGSGPVASATGLPARVAAPIERTNMGYQAPATPGAPPQMTLPLSPPAKGMTPTGLPTLVSPAKPAGDNAGLISRLTPTNAAKYEPPSSADIDKALDGLTPGGDVTAGVSASAGSGPNRGADGVPVDAAAPSGIVDPNSEATQIADRLPDFASVPTRISPADQPAPKPSLDARLSALGAAVADVPAPGMTAPVVAKDKVPALEASPAAAEAARSAKLESRPGARANTPPPAKRPTALIIGGALAAAIAVVIAATKLTSSGPEQEALRNQPVAQQPAPEPAPPPAAEPVPSPPPVAAAEATTPTPSAPTVAPAAAPPPAAATEPAPPAPAPTAAAPEAETKPKDEPAAAKAAKPTSAPRKAAVVAAKKPAAPAEPAEAKPADDNPAAPTPEAQLAQSLLKVTSTPAGAEVLLDGKSVGKTPYQGKQVDVTAPHALTVKLDGYEPYEHMLGASDWTKGKNNVQAAKVNVKLRKTAGATTAAKAEGTKSEGEKSEIGPPAVEILTPEPIKPESSEPKKIEAPAPTP